MDARVDPWLLWPRAVGVGVVTFGFGVVGHVTADGLLPGPGLLGALLAMAVVLSAPMLARPATRLRLVAMLVGGQTVVHLVLTVTAGHRGDAGASTATGPAPPGLPSLPTVDGHRVGSLQDAYHGATGQAGALAPSLPLGHLIGDLQAHAPMMAAHLAAAIAVGLWLGYGERCLWTVLALTGDRVLMATWALVPAPAAPVLHRAAAARRAPDVRASRWQARPHSRRGPPVVA